ncbi:DUF1905 domain-containing protein [Phenylobacterium sp. J426]|uniref:DUF1905 domain-containing protein n=1 Tax=Phenylobacterium sp. J426 TaxID=2898439 RepID=UPI0021512CB9|nr:DUF1905 domain-containing protein [Phenylobacterium sp. J426]MCR5874296.1 DUF1905 domain-containing protein [Phenylobacterium sp. J426]
MSLRYEAEAEIWAYDGPGAWHFITLPRDIAEGIRTVGGRRAPFGSLRVTAAIGEVRWKTSLFADRKRGSFLLPVKADVRRRAQVSAGQTTAFSIEIET